MKKQLLFCFALVMFATQAFKSQTKTWKFSDAIWGTPPTAAFTSNVVVDNLGIGVGPSTVATFGIIDLNNKTSADDNTTYTARFKFGGASWTSADTAPYVLPVQRYLYFKVNGASTINVYYISSSSGANTTINVTDGTNVIGTGTANGTVLSKLTVNYAGAAGNIYVGAIPAQGVNVYAITATNVGTTTTLATSDVALKNPSKIYATAGVVHISNVTADSKVSVYTSEGRLVKSVDTKTNADLPLKAGFYIVNIVSEKGTLSQKVLVK